MRQTISRSALLCCLALLPNLAFAQATLTGVVKDPSGASLPGVTVEAASPALIEKVRVAVTDGTGQYRIEDLRPGTYALTFTLQRLQRGQARGYPADGIVHRGNGCGSQGRTGGRDGDRDWRDAHRGRPEREAPDDDRQRGDPRHPEHAQLQLDGRAGARRDHQRQRHRRRHRSPHSSRFTVAGRTRAV